MYAFSATSISISRKIFLLFFSALHLSHQQKNSTYPSQAGAIGIILIMRIIFFPLDTTKIQSFGIICKVYCLNFHG